MREERVAEGVGGQMKGFGSRRWTEGDRERLRELAGRYSSDAEIAREMGRRPSAVGWQRRVMRVRLAGESGAAKRSYAREASRRIAGGAEAGRPMPVSSEPGDWVERMMRMARLSA